MVENAKTVVIRANNAQYLTVSVSPPDIALSPTIRKKLGPPPRETRILISRAIQTSSSNGLNLTRGRGGGGGEDYRCAESEILQIFPLSRRKRRAR